jgi:hypothetical protein
VASAAGAEAYLKLGTDIGGTIVGIRWQNQPIRYFIKNRDAAGVSTPELRAAVERALDEWTGVPTASVSAEFAGFTDAEPSVDDGLSVIGFQFRPDFERVLGTTSFTLDDVTGEILESDIILNTTVPWSTAAEGVAGRYDAESIAVHEIGHLLGLGHSALGETELQSGGNRRVLGKRAVMFPFAFPPGNIDDRSLEADDVAGVSDIYANTAFNREAGSVSGRVTQGGRGVFGAHVVAFNIGTGAIHATFSLSSAGDFVLAGLPRGLYVLRAEPIDDADVDSFFDSDTAADVGFRPAYASALAVVPAGGRGERVDIAVEAK